MFSKETRIGLLAVVAIALLIWGYKFLKGKNILTTSNLYYVEYEHIDLLVTSSPVLINGFQVGMVTSISIDPEDLQTLVVELDVRRDVTIPKNTVAEIVSTSVMGGKAINLSFNGPCINSDCADNGDFLKGTTKGLVASMIGTPDEFDEYVSVLTNGLGSVLDSLARTAGDESTELGKGLRDVQITLANLRSLTTKLDNMASASSGKINSILTNIDGLSESINASNGQIKSIIENASTFTSQLNDVDLKATAANTNEAIEKLSSTLTSADEALAELGGVVQKIKEGEGTLGMLAQDEKLYINLEKTTRNLDLLLQDFRLNPKRYVNVSVFGKKQKEYTVPEDDPAEGKEENK